MLQTKVVKKKQVFYINDFFLENRAVYEIMCKYCFLWPTRRRTGQTANDNMVHAGYLRLQMNTQDK